MVRLIGQDAAVKLLGFRQVVRLMMLYRLREVVVAVSHRTLSCSSLLLVQHIG
jgi:hypothetical protein